MAEETGALYRFYDVFEIGGLLAPNTAPNYANGDRAAKVGSCLSRAISRRGNHWMIANR